MCRIIYPKTFEEYAKKNDWKEEWLNDEYAPYCKDFYERAAKIINNIYPFYQDDLEKLGGPKMAADLTYCFNASISTGCMEEEGHKELLKFLDDIEELEEDIYMHLGFIIDEFVELYSIYLKGEF